MSQNAPEDEAGAPLELARPYLLPVAPAARHRAAVALRSRRRPLIALLATAGLLLAVAAVAAPDGTPETTASLPSARPLSTATPDYGAPPSAAALSTPSEAGSPATTPSAPGAPTAAPRPTTGRPATSPAAQPAAPATTAAAQSPAAAPPPVTYTAVTGESCPSAATRGYYRSGWHTDWHSGGGGWSGDGCGGRSVSMPMSGSDSVDDPDNVIVWWFRTGSVTRGACAISVYVPGTGQPLDSAGKPAHYMVYGSTSPSGSTIATFKVDQTANQGRWVTGATVTVTGGQLSVRLGSRGIDWGSSRDGAHLGVAALKVSCKAS